MEQARKLTNVPLKGTISMGKYVFQPLIFRGHVSFPGSRFWICALVIIFLVSQRRISFFLWEHVLIFTQQRETAVKLSASFWGGFYSKGISNAHCTTCCPFFDAQHERTTCMRMQAINEVSTWPYFGCKDGGRKAVLTFRTSHENWYSMVHVSCHFFKTYIIGNIFTVTNSGMTLRCPEWSGVPDLCSRCQPGTHQHRTLEDGLCRNNNKRRQVT